ncbi:MAG: hypothetical protein GY865_05620, partial [candidate division Zixibacteria bacterium]|nr:hypothetical protein [candidate division Zixibacteria bacterium]
MIENNNRNKIFWLAYIYLIVLILIRFIPIINPESRTWGFNHLIFLPDIYNYVFFAIASLALVIPFINSSEKAGEKLTNWFSDKFIDGRHRYLYRFVFIAIMTSLFAIFTAPTHFLGDGYRVIENLGTEMGMLTKWSEIGILGVMWSIRELLGPPDKETALLAFQVVSIFSGAVTIYFIFLIAKIASENNLKRFIVFTTATFSGGMLLFFGYAEYYPVVWVLMSGLIYFGLKYLRYSRGLFLTWLFLIIGIILHVQMSVFIPAVIYLSFANGKGLNFYNRFKIIIWSVFALLFVSCLLFLINEYTTNLAVEDIFLPLYNGKPASPEYAILSLPHLLDIINELILLSPLLFLLLLMAGNNIRNIFKYKTAIFTGLGAGGSLLFMFVIDPKIGFPRDWDLFSLAGLSLMLFAVTLFKNNNLQYFKRLIISIAMILSIYSVPFLLTSLNIKASEKYIESLIDLDMERSQSSITILTGYYRENGYKDKFDSITAVWNREFMEDRYISSAFKAIVAGDLEEAKKFVKLIKPNKFNADYLRFLAMYYIKVGRLELALDNINKAI